MRERISLFSVDGICNSASLGSEEWADVSFAGFPAGPLVRVEPVQLLYGGFEQCVRALGCLLPHPVRFSGHRGF